MSSSSPDHQQNPSWQRTVLLASDSSQSIIAEVADGKTNAIAYSAYGEQSAQQEVATGLGFNGQLREARLGWYLLGNGYRAYNPRLMRFHSPDSWSPFGRGGLNPYMYCVGDPVNRSDPTGHAGGFWSLFKSPNYRVGTPPYISPEAGGRAMRSMLKDQPLPEKTHDLSGVFGASGLIAGPKPKISWANDGGEIHGISHSSFVSQNPEPLVPWVVSQRSSDSPPSGSFGTYHQTASTISGSSSHSEQVSSHGQKSGMKLWSSDTFAASQQPSSYSTYPVGVGSPPPRQGPVRSGDTSGSSTWPPSVARPGGSTHNSNDRPTAAVAGVRRGSDSPPPLPPRGIRNHPPLTRTRREP